MAERFRILVVDDEATQRELVCGYLNKQGFEVFAAPSAERALELFRLEPVELILTDQRMPNLSGLDLLKAAQAINPETSVIVMTAYGNIETAVESMKAGAADYLTKPLHLEELLHKIRRIREQCRLYEENRELREELKERHRIEGVIGESGQMLEVISLVQRVAPSEATVLIRGESGTGKELIARAIHYASPRAARPLVRVNCAALPENLLESELFGHERGAFTGAVAARKGRFELADGGSLFLDEIGDLPLHLQAKLLRVLQEREFERVGSSQTLKVNVRVLSATNRDLEAMIKSGRFREELYYRLNVVTLLLPPLRERRQDLPALMEHFLKHFAAKNSKTIRGFSHEARQALLRYDYPGNVRELENLIERAVVLTRDDVVGRGDLPLTLEESEERTKQETQLTAAVEGLERRMIKDALASSGGVQTRAADQLGITERALRYKLKKYGLQGDDPESSSNPRES
jgi:DNA-binding NtrC family response regulator